MMAILLLFEQEIHQIMLFVWADWLNITQRQIVLILQVHSSFNLFPVWDRRFGYNRCQFKRNEVIMLMIMMCLL